MIYRKSKKNKKAFSTKKMKMDNYTGEMLNDLPNGRGKYTEKNQYYDGDFIDGKIFGMGRLYKDGNIYEGYFVDGYLHNGTIIFKNGSSYTGELINGKPQGIGKMYLQNGDILDGEFGKDEFWGKFIREDEVIKEGYISRKHKEFYPLKKVLTNEECPLCFDETKNDEMVELTNCACKGKYYHKSCIIESFEKAGRRCPFCRKAGFGRKKSKRQSNRIKI